MADTDRGLLELAARAAELSIDWDTWLDCGSYYLYRISGTQDYWNPLTDDGDAMRLAVQCKMEIYFDGTDGSVAVGYAPVGNPRIRYCIEQADGDIFAATRRAIVRAAAELGRAAAAIGAEK